LTAGILMHPHFAMKGGTAINLFDRATQLLVQA
jgi:hypothetical protein